MAANDEETFTTTDVASMFEVPRHVVRAWIAKGLLRSANEPFIRGQVGMETRFTRSEINRFAQEKFGSK